LRTGFARDFLAGGGDRGYFPAVPLEFLARPATTWTALTPLIFSAAGIDQVMRACPCGQVR
jgi:hypothetical protein